MTAKTSPYNVPVALRQAGPLVEGAVLAGRYVLKATLGRGGYGTVFRAWDDVLGTPVAVKVLGRESSRNVDLPRMAREVRLARAIRHPNVCPVYDLGQEADLWFITMELGAGTLGDELRAEAAGGEPASWEQRVRDAFDVGAGLSAIHAIDIAHRDLKPSNVLRMMNGRLAIGDFGLALSTGTQTVLPSGTPRYFAPEVVAGQSADQRSDVWQLGLLMHEILLRQQPRWLSSNGIPTPCVPVSGLPTGAAALLEIATRCLAWRREDRPASACAIDAPRPQD